MFRHIGLKEKMSWDPVWEKIFQENEWGRYPAEHLVRFIAKNFYARNRENTKILEVGCGPGANLWYLAREGFDVYGIDGSRTAIQMARSRLNKENLKANLNVGDIVSLGYIDNFFDAVIDNECLYCSTLFDAEKIMKEIQRVLKKGGLFFSRTLADNMDIGFSRKESGHLEYTGIRDCPFAGNGFARLIDKEGIARLYGKFFNILSVEKIEYTINNGESLVSEWIIIADKQ